LNLLKFFNKKVAGKTIQQQADILQKLLPAAQDKPERRQDLERGLSQGLNTCSALQDSSCRPCY
jgi:hypothetical protein